MICLTACFLTPGPVFPFTAPLLWKVSERVVKGFPWKGPVVKNPPCNSRDMSSTPDQETETPHAEEQLSPSHNYKAHAPHRKILPAANNTLRSQLKKYFLKRVVDRSKGSGEMNPRCNHNPSNHRNCLPVIASQDLIVFIQYSTRLIDRYLR